MTITPSTEQSRLEYIIEPGHDKTNKMTVHPGKTQISLKGDGEKIAI